MKQTVRFAATIALCGGFTAPAFAADITGAGASFPYPLYAKWAEAYKAKTGNQVNYQSIGSGGGIKQIESKTVDFGASDMPLKAEDLAKKGLVQFPTVIGGVVPVVNLPGVTPGQLKLTGALLSDIYLGKVSNWNDPAIAKLNPGVKLPDQKITPVRRSDGSGTTFVFTDYLSKVSPEWKSAIGANTTVAWKVGVGGKGNEGVANYVNRIKGSVGYVEYAYAKVNKLSHAAVQNAAGAFVQPDDKTFAAAAAGADWKGTPGFSLILTNAQGKESWPITSATFILMQKSTDKAEGSSEALKFFDWAYKDGSQMALQLNYVPLPANVQNLIRTSWKEIKTSAGQSVWK